MRIGNATRIGIEPRTRDETRIRNAEARIRNPETRIRVETRMRIETRIRIETRARNAETRMRIETRIGNEARIGNLILVGKISERLFDYPCHFGSRTCPSETPPRGGCPKDASFETIGDFPGNGLVFQGRSRH